MNDIVYSVDVEGKLIYISPQVARYGFDAGGNARQEFHHLHHAGGSKPNRG